MAYEISVVKGLKDTLSTSLVWSKKKSTGYASVAETKKWTPWYPAQGVSRAINAWIKSVYHQIRPQADIYFHVGLIYAA